ncbi:hypothetical protein [Mucilaginibacter antarcticus]|uniref:Carbohydrate binding protein with CBM6 domain n=1 Tax=Mucilaginibacter antarcticus TaxID=1855725 RepID=A0ABW5XRB5_9SPHI
MKKIFTNVQLGLLGLIATLAVSCKNEKLTDVVNPINASNAKVSVSVDSKIDIVKGGNFTLNGAELSVPLTITFSNPTSAAFTVDLSTNVDTVAKLITAGTLPAGTVAFPVGAAAVLPQINIPSGVKTFTTNIIVSRSTMEVLYGKTLAAVIKLGVIGKGNTVATGKSTTILTVKTGELLDAASVHELYFGTPTSTTNIINAVASPSNYTLSSQNITFNVPVTLQGDPGAELTVDAVFSQDSVTKYINSGLLATSQTYDASKISFSPSVKIIAGSSTAVFTFSTNIKTLLAVQPAAGAATIKYPTVAFTLKNPTKYKTTEKASKTVYVVMDPNFFRPYYGTPFVIKGAIGVESAPIYAAYYDLGGEGIGYHENDVNKDGDGNWRLPDLVDVPGEYSPRSSVGWIGTGEYLTWSVNVEADGVYDMNLLLGSNNTNGRVTAFLDNVLLTPTQIAVTNTGAYGNQLPHRTDVTLTKGYHIFKLFMNNGNHDYRGAIFTRKS